MADAGDKKQQEQNLALRQALADAYSFVESSKANQTFAALTFEDLLDQQIEQISGKGTTARPNKLDRVNNIATNIASSVAQIKALPPDAFRIPDSKQDVNTPVDEKES